MSVRLKLILSVIVSIILIAVLFLLIKDKKQIENWKTSEPQEINIFDKNYEVGKPTQNQKPQISHLAMNDLDNDTLLDVIVCDMLNNTVSWIQQKPEETYNEYIIAENIKAPAHVEIIDFDNDADKDIIVAVLGQLFPSNDKIGAVVVLENLGNSNFKTHRLLENVPRVCDVRAADIDNDGDKDLTVALFGYDDGETRWLENLGNWDFKSHTLQNLAGPLNVEFVDIDNDNDLDIVSLVTQESEEIYGFINDGKGNFTEKLFWGANNKDYGSSGISLADINKDGYTDIVYTNGDAFDYVPPRPRPWHGIQWLENKGDLSFDFHRICNLPGAFSPRVFDVDNDNDNDILVISGFNIWDTPSTESFVWLENNGYNKFVKHKIANTPTHLITLDIGDINNDGYIDAITGGVYAYPPFNNIKRITLWEGISTKK